MRTFIYRGKPSDGANALRSAIPESMLLRSQGSTYTHRPNKLIVNWGSSNSEAFRLCEVSGGGGRGNLAFLNKPASVSVAANKLATLTWLADLAVPVVPFYTELGPALTHIRDGRGRIYVRTKLTGSGGEGIEVLVKSNDPNVGVAGAAPYPTHLVDTLDPELPRSVSTARLFTVGIMGKRNEWRVHVFKGRAILAQLKVRRNGAREVDGYTSLVRNVEAGWVYSVNFPREEYSHLSTIERTAIAAVEALGLDFGAVDLLDRKGEPFVLEVNTAPGLEEGGSAVQAYADAIIEYSESINQQQQEGLF